MIRISPGNGYLVPKLIIHCIRHAQGFHNLNEANHKLPDPDLTPFGELQCATLRKNFPFHDRITHLVASPMRRTIYTCLLAFESEIQKGEKITALPELQETSDLPADTGSDIAKLSDELGAGPWKGIVDLSLVHDGWNDKSPQTKWAPDPNKIELRAREARRWLRDIGMKYGGDAEIVVVTHGGYLHYFTEDWSGHEKFAGTGWENTEFRSYTFNSLDDEDASVIETSDSKQRRNPNQPLTGDELRQLRLTAEKQ